MSSPKRPAPSLERDSKKPRRNPALSCQLCRIKKIKCSRVFPCSNCVTRNVECVPQDAGSMAALGGTGGFYRYSGVPEASSSRTASAGPPDHQKPPNPRRSYESSFRVDTPEPMLSNSLAPSGICMLSMVATREAQIQDRDSLKTANLLEELAMSGGQARFTPQQPIPDPIGRPEESAAAKPSSSPGTGLLDTPSVATLAPRIRHPYHENAVSRMNIFDSPKPQLADRIMNRLPPEADAVHLLANYFDLIHPIYHIVHEPTAYQQLKDVYTNYNTLETESLASAVSLLYTFLSIGAFYWPSGKVGGLNLTTSASGQLARKLQNGALDALSVANFMSCPTLETMQACTLLSLVMHGTREADAFGNMSGALVRMGQSLGLHRLGSHLKSGENRINFELKRRLWWFITATDWLESTQSGPRRGTYLISQNHIKTSYPTHCDDSDITETYCVSRPSDAPTGMSYFFARLQLSVVAREVVDTLGMHPSHEPDGDYDAILALDTQYRSFLKSLPKFFKVDAKSRAEAGEMIRDRPYLRWQRTMLHCQLNGMLSRLHSPFLVRGSQEPRLAYSRMVALRSAHALLGLYRRIYFESISEPPAMKLWIGVQNLFIAATVLAIDLSCNEEDPHVEETKKEIMTGCQILEESGEEKTVRTFLGILVQWKEEQRDDGGSTSEEAAEGAGVKVEVGLGVEVTAGRLWTELVGLAEMGGSEFLDWGGLLEDLAAEGE